MLLYHMLPMAHKRKIISLELLSSSRLEKLKGVRMLELENAIKSIYELWRDRKDGEGKVLVEMNKWGGGVDSEDEDEIKRRRELIREWFHYMGVYVVGDAVPFQGWLDLGGHEKPIKTITSGLDSVFGKILDEHRQKRASAGETENE
ncbi:cytochrome P450 CYP82D47-like protein [Tanacetum coccineum]